LLIWRENSVSADTVGTQVAEPPNQETQAAATPDKEAKPDKGTDALQSVSRRVPATVASLSVLAVISAVTAASAFYALPNLGGLIKEPQHEIASVPILDPAVSATLKDIQSLQQQDAAVLRRNAATLEQNEAMLESLRQSSIDQRSDLKRISDQLSSLAAKADALQNAVTPVMISVIPKPRARTVRSSATKLLRLPIPVGPVSVGGAPLSPVPLPRSG
jgi:hypothetical protein